jgi:lipoprotein-anchoring transpeptidase ErfK/SrfK
LSSASADPLQVAVYPYGQPAYAAQQQPPQQYYYYVQQPRYVAAPAYSGQTYAQGYAPNYAPGYAPRYAAAPQGYAPAPPQTYAPAPQGYAPAPPQTYAPAPQGYAAPQPQTYAAAVPQIPAAVAPPSAAPAEPAGSSGGGFLQAIFGGPTINVPVAHVYPYQAPQPQSQPQAVAPVQQASYEPTNPTDESNYPIDPQFMRQIVAYNGSEPAGTIIVDTPDKFLYLVEDGGKAMRYGIGVGRPGFTWSGVKTITAMKKWPDWTPPPEMIERQPGIPHFMPGGLGNPLGSRALYLGSTLYRIHGSNEPWTIGHNVSSGCIRMRNADVEDLYGRVHVGTKVVIM